MRLLALSLCHLALLGCSNQDTTPAVGDGAAGASGGGAAGMGMGGASGSGGSGGQPSCSTDVAPPGADPVCLRSVGGRLVSDDGSPLAGVVTSVCGPICFYGETAADGTFEVVVEAMLTPADYSILAHARPDRATFYFRLPNVPADGVVEMGDLPALALPGGVPLKLDGTAQAVTSGEVTLHVDDGVTVKLDPEDLAAGDAGRNLRALRVPAERFAEFGVDPSHFAVYAFAPFEAWFRNADKSETTARLSFATDGSRAAGTKIEVAALGSYLFPTWITPAAFEPIATGTVSTDGTTIEMDSGEGLRYLTWVALRELP